MSLVNRLVTEAIKLDYRQSNCIHLIRIVACEESRQVDLTFPCVCSHPFALFEAATVALYSLLLLDGWGLTFLELMFLPLIKAEVELNQWPSSFDFY